jgi:hypothetical protein
MSCDLIYLVQGDSNRPQIQATITNENTGAVVSLVDATLVELKFRMVGATTLQATIIGSITDAANGVVVFPMSSTAMSGTPGNYEGEIQITFGGAAPGVQTVYDTLKFKLREDF